MQEYYKFEEGDRVEYSALGRESIKKEWRSTAQAGTVTKNEAYMVAVKWDGADESTTYHKPFIQIIKQSNPNKMEQTFFRALYALLTDKQVVKITCTRVGENLTLLINKDGKLISMNGNPEEVDGAIIDHLKVTANETKQEFTVSVSDAPEEKGESKPAATSGSSSSKKKKATKPAAKKSAAPAKKKAVKAKASSKKKKEEEPTDSIHEADLKETLIPEKNSEKDEAAKQALKEYTTSIDAGNKAMKANDFEGAAIHFGAAVDQALNADAVAFAEKKLESANAGIEELKRQAQKKEFDELMKLGTTQRTERKYEESLATFKKALEMFPENAEAIKQVAAAEKWIKALEEL